MLKLDQYIELGKLIVQPQLHIECSLLFQAERRRVRVM